MNQLFKIIGATITACLILPSCGMSQMHVVSDIEETFDGIEEVVVKGGALEVTYEGSDRASDVFLNAYLESNREHGLEIFYKVEGSRLRVELRRENSNAWGNFKSKGFISLTGPENIKLQINNSSGPLFVSNVISDKIDLSISSGNIEARNLSCDRINLTASSGKMNIEDINGHLISKMSSGKCNISKVSGDVSVEASSGSFHISEVDGTVNGTLSSGSMTLEEISELGSFTVSSGRVVANQVGLGENTRFNGSSGSFVVKTYSNLDDFNFNLSSSSGGLEVGPTKTRKNLSINNRSNATVSGSVSSGKISIQN